MGPNDIYENKDYYYYNGIPIDRIIYYKILGFLEGNDISHKVSFYQNHYCENDINIELNYAYTEELVKEFEESIDCIINESSLGNIIIYDNRKWCKNDWGGVSPDGKLKYI